MKKNFIYPVFFQDNKRKEHVIAEVQTMEEAFSAIRDFLTARDYESYYTRLWVEPYTGEDSDKDSCRLVFDVGSWSEFFNIYFDSKEQANAFLNSTQK